MQELLHVGKVSNAGLLAVMKKLKQTEVPDKNLKSLHDAAFKSRYHKLTYIEEMPLADGGVFKWPIVEASLFLQHLLGESPALRGIYTDAFLRHKLPWRLVISFDEFTPGNKLRLDNARKCMVVSVTFLELSSLRFKESAWMTIAVIRSSQIHKIRGGFGHCLRQLLRRLLGGPLGLASSGVPLDVGGNSYLLFARLANILSDGDGLRMGLDVKGSSGIRPCILCCNVLKRDTDLAHRREGFVETTCFDFSKFERMTSQEVATTVSFLTAANAKVQEGSLPKVRFAELEMMHGITYSSESIFADAAFVISNDVVNSITYDWVHCSLQDGFMTTEAFLYLSVTGTAPSDVEAFLKSTRFKFPRSLANRNNSLHRIFSSYRSSSEAERLKRSASELLGLYVLLRYFVQTTTPPKPNRDAKMAFELGCECIDLILLLKRGHLDAEQGSRQLEQAQRRYMEAHVRAHGDSHIRPKHHFQLRIPSQVRRDGAVLDAFVVERMHLRVKQIADLIHNTSAFEASVLAGVLNLQFQSARDILKPDDVRGKTAQVDINGTRATVADHLSFHGWDLHCDDLVVRQDVFGKVIACLRKESPSSSSSSSSSS